MERKLHQQPYRPQLGKVDFVQELDSHRPFLLRLAKQQLQTEQDAEDVVQDTLLAAWRAIDSFHANSTLRTWLVGILRFKLIDRIRDNYRFAPSKEAAIDESNREDFSDLFDKDGVWAEMPKTWPESWTCPQTELEHKQLLLTLEACLARLPAQTGRIFLMREYLEFKTTEIAQILGLEGGNVRVLLLRARMRLRTCLGVQIDHEEQA